MSEPQRRRRSDVQEQFVPLPPIDERTMGDLKRILESIVPPGIELETTYLDGVFERVNEIRWLAAARLTSVEQDRTLLSLQTQVAQLTATLGGLSPQVTSALLNLAAGRSDAGEANFLLFVDAVVKMDKRLTSLLPKLRLKDPKVRRVNFYTHLIGDYLYHVYADISGGSPRRSVSIVDGHDQGPFVDFLQAAFKSLDIAASARSQVRLIIDRLENSETILGD